MNNFLAVVLVTIFFAVHCYGDVVSQNSVDPDLPGMCFYNEEYYDPGEHQLPGCSRLICSPRGWASVHNCIAASAIKGCFRGNEIGADLPFPECCKREYTCQRDDGSVYTMINF